MLNLEGLEHREFAAGSTDCLGLVRDLYKLNFGIEMRNYARPSDWDADKLDLINAVYQREGFEKLSHWSVGDLRPGDILCMCVGSSNVNHMGVYVGDNQFIHHLRGNLSSRGPLETRWLHYTAFLLRHPDVPDLRPEMREITIEELLSDRYKIETGSSS